MAGSEPRLRDRLDHATQKHAERIARLAFEIGRELGLDGRALDELRQAAPLHDIGKLAVPEEILLKPGRLDPAEMAIARRHAAAGAQMLTGLAAEIAHTHHERWDGTGYPAGLAGEEIPLAGRIVAVADVFDALISERPYKPAWPVERAIAEIRAGAGTHFDPAVVAAFLVVMGVAVRRAAA